MRFSRGHVLVEAGGRIFSSSSNAAKSSSIDASGQKPQQAWSTSLTDPKIAGWSMKLCLAILRLVPLGIQQKVLGKQEFLDLLRCVFRSIWHCKYMIFGNIVGLDLFGDI